MKSVCIGIHVYEQPEHLRSTLGIDAREVAVVGDDLPDLPPMRAAGLAIAVADAQEEVRAAADWVTRSGGGNGAVREVADGLLAARRTLA